MGVTHTTVGRVTDSLTIRDNRTGDEHEIPITDGTISAGEFGPGDRLPSETFVQQAAGVNRLTVRKSYRMLIDEGLIVTVQGRGSFVLPVDET